MQVLTHVKKNNIMIPTKGYAAQTAETNLAPWNFERRELGLHDVCGPEIACHSKKLNYGNES